MLNLNQATWWTSMIWTRSQPVWPPCPLLLFHETISCSPVLENANMIMPRHSRHGHSSQKVSSCLFHSWKLCAYSCWTTTKQQRAQFCHCLKQNRILTVGQEMYITINRFQLAQWDSFAETVARQTQTHRERERDTAMRWAELRWAIIASGCDDRVSDYMACTQ